MSYNHLMSLTGATLKVDPETGYMVAGANYSLTGLQPKHKIKFLEAFRECGDFGQSAKSTGFNRNTFTEHLNIDEKFRDDFKIVLESIGDELEGVMLNRAKHPNGFMDRIAWLRAHRPGKYNPRTVIVHENDKRGLDFLLDRMKETGQVIEISPTKEEPS